MNRHIHWLINCAVFVNLQTGDKIWLLFRAVEALPRRGAFENWGTNDGGDTMSVSVCTVITSI